MVSPAYVVLSLGNVLEPRFANYLFQSRVMVAQFVTSSKGVGDIQRDIHLPWLKNAKVPIPSPAQQTAIVRYLDYVGRRIRRYIRARLKLVELLEERKQAIIQRAVIRGLDANVRLTPSGIEWLGDTPQHWEVVLNQRIFREVSRPHGGMVETQLSLSQKAGLIATSEMQERSLQTSTYDNWKVTLPGDLVVNRFKAHLGVFFASTLRGIVSFHYGVFAPRRELVVKYFELLYHTNVYKTIYAGRSNGMTVGLQNLSNQNFYNVRSIVPPVSEQLGIVSFVERITERVSDRVRAVRGEIDLVREYRSRLIADVVTGRLDVREAAARLPQEMDDLGILEYTNAPLEGDEEAETEKLDADEEDRADA
jgi:type I restriction enzyme S subunit